MFGTPSVHGTSFLSSLILYFWMAIGAFLAAFAIEIFFIPNSLIDGGIVGVSMILGKVYSNQLIPLFLILFNIPFLVVAYQQIGKAFLIHMIVAVLLFSGFMILMPHIIETPFVGDKLEVVVIGGAILGVGLGLIIRSGGCLDGTEIMGLIINKKLGFTVGQIVLFCNVFVFGAAGFVFQDWHPPLLSFITYFVALKVMDAVIVGLEETKSVIVVSKKSREITQAVTHEMGLGLTVMYGRGGFSGEDQEILYIIVERLQLHDLKKLIFREDPNAFLAIENLHEVANGMQNNSRAKKSAIERLMRKVLQKPKSYGNSNS